VIRIFSVAPLTVADVLNVKAAGELDQASRTAFIDAWCLAEEPACSSPKNIDIGYVLKLLELCAVFTN
jgi:hypothetical protein